MFLPTPTGKPASLCDNVTKLVGLGRNFLSLPCAHIWCEDCYDSAAGFPFVLLNCIFLYCSILYLVFVHLYLCNFCISMHVFVNFTLRIFVFLLWRGRFCFLAAQLFILYLCIFVLPYLYLWISLCVFLLWWRGRFPFRAAQLYIPPVRSWLRNCTASAAPIPYLYLWISICVFLYL